MQNLCIPASCILILASAALQADDSAPPSFLKPGQDYAIRFAGQSPFEKTVRVPMDSDQIRKRNASITSASITYSVTVFTVVALPGDSWILAEHPKSIEDALKWNLKRVAMAALSRQSIAALQSTDDGKRQLEKLREQAATEIETSRTWINLRHVVTISKPRIELLGLDKRAGAGEEELQAPLSSQLENKKRSLWLHPDGFFEQTEKGKWREVSPNGRQYQFTEVARNPESVELQAVDGDTSIRVRLFGDRAESTNLPQPAFAKKFDGRWHSLVTDAKSSNQRHISGLAPGMQFRGEKTWTKIGAVFQRGTKQWHVLRIKKVAGQKFSGSVEFEWGKSPVAVDGLTDGRQIQWANSDTRDQAYYGVIDGSRISAVSFNGTISLVHEKN